MDRYNQVRKIIAVCGSDSGDENLTTHALKVAEDVGYYISMEKSAVLLCGGRNGVMEAASKGAKKNGGLVIGMLPGSKEEANDFIEIAIPTGLGLARNHLIINSADAVIGICGRWGTLNELSFSMDIKKPTIVIKGTGGCADMLSDPKIVGRFKTKPYVANSAKDAVEMAFKFIS
jgi:hypothetical protein